MINYLVLSVQHLFKEFKSRFQIDSSTHRQNLLRRTLGHMIHNHKMELIYRNMYCLSNRIVLIDMEKPESITIQVDRNYQTYNFEIFFCEPVHPRPGKFGIVGQIGRHDFHQKLTFA